MEIEQQFEVEIGLPRRFQLDLYAVTHKEGNTGTLALDETKLEVRWALADWGRLWGNPALYLEWKALSGEPDHIEGKLLLGGQIAQGLHWGTNLVFEHEMGGEQTNAMELTAGLSYTVRDEKISAGAEVKLAGRRPRQPGALRPGVSSGAELPGPPAAAGASRHCAARGP